MLSDNRFLPFCKARASSALPSKIATIQKMVFPTDCSRIFRKLYGPETRPIPFKIKRGMAYSNVTPSAFPMADAGRTRFSSIKRKRQMERKGQSKWLKNLVPSKNSWANPFSGPSTKSTTKKVNARHTEEI